MSSSKNPAKYPQEISVLLSLLYSRSLCGAEPFEINKPFTKNNATSFCFRFHYYLEAAKGPHHSDEALRAQAEEVGRVYMIRKTERAGAWYISAIPRAGSMLGIDVMMAMLEEITSLEAAAGGAAALQVQAPLAASPESPRNWLNAFKAAPLVPESTSPEPTGEAISISSDDPTGSVSPTPAPGPLTGILIDDISAEK